MSCKYIMRYREILNERVLDTALFHGTDIMSAARILVTDEIIAKSDQRIAGKTTSGVSLTRSFRFAVDWKRFGAIFKLDTNRLRMKSKIIPFDYYHDRREAEEFLIGSIKPLSTVLLNIFITPETKDWCVEHDENLIEGHKDFEELLAHPLLKVISFPSPVPYKNPRKPETGMFDQTPPSN